MSRTTAGRPISALARVLRVKKKWPGDLQRLLDREVEKILVNPLGGEPKKGALAGVRVHKFTYHQQLYLIGYLNEKAGVSVSWPLAPTRTSEICPYGIHTSSRIQHTKPRNSTPPIPSIRLDVLLRP